MKQLQNDYTTPEQSKQLLELGVPKWTANGLRCMRGIKLLEKPDKDNPNPCWTLGRLIEIELMCREEREGLLPRLAFVHGSVSYIEELICYIERKDHKYNFNKLED